METYFSESAKIVKNSLVHSKSIVISEAPSNGVQKEKFIDVRRGGRHFLS